MIDLRSITQQMYTFYSDRRQLVTLRDVAVKFNAPKELVVRMFEIYGYPVPPVKASEVKK